MVNSQTFIKKRTQQIKNDENQKPYSHTLLSRNVSDNSFLSQAVLNIKQSLPRCPISWTRPLQTYEATFANKTMGLISLMGPLSHYSSFPSRIAQNWKANKNDQQSLMRYGASAYQNKKTKNIEPQNICIDQKKFNSLNADTFFILDSLIKIQPTFSFSKTWHTEKILAHKLNLFPKDTKLEVRILSNNVAFKRDKVSETYWQPYAKARYSNQKNYSDLHIDFYKLNVKAKKNLQKPYQTNQIFLDLVSTNSEENLDHTDQTTSIQKLDIQEIKACHGENSFIKLEKKLRYPNFNFLGKRTQEWHAESQELLKSIFIKKSLEQLTFFWNANKNEIDQVKTHYKRLSPLSETRRIAKYENLKYQRKKIKKIDELEKKNFINNTLWKKEVALPTDQWTKTFYKNIRNESGIRNYDLFHQWKKNFLRKKNVKLGKKQDQRDLIDHQVLFTLSRLFYKTLSLRHRAFFSSVLMPSFQLLSIDLWWALFIACGMGLVVQYEEDNTTRSKPHRPVSLSPLSIWRLYWNQKPAHPFWLQVIKSLQLRTSNWIQPRAIQLQNLFRTRFSPLVALSIRPRSISWMSSKTACAILNIVDAIENFIECISDKLTMASINFHTGTNYIVIEQLDQVRHLSRRLGPSCDDALVAILGNPMTQFFLFLARHISYSAVWWTLVPLRLIGFFYSLGWKIWYFIPKSIKIYLENRGRESRFQWTFERAINYRGMLAGSQHTLDHPDGGGGIAAVKRIRLTNLLLRMSNICDAELSSIACPGIARRYTASTWDVLVPKSSLFIESVGSRRDEWLQLASDHWKLPLIHLKLDRCLHNNQMSLIGEEVSIQLDPDLAETKIASERGGQNNTSTVSHSSSASSMLRGKKENYSNLLFQVIRPDEVLPDGTIAPSMNRPGTVAEDYIVRHFMIAAAAIPSLFIVDGLNIFYDTEYSDSYLAVRELRERSSTGGLSYEEKMFGLLPNTGYLTVDYWDILGMPNQLEKEAEEEDYEIEELEDDPPEIRKAKLALNARLGAKKIREWIALPQEGGITGWETMELFHRNRWKPPATLLYLLWLLDKFPRTPYGIRFGIGTLLTIKEPLLRKRRWDKIYILKSLTWIDRERVLQVLMMRTGSLRLEEQALQQVLPRSQGYNLAEIHSFVNEMALCKVQANLHLKWGKEWAWEDGLFLSRMNKPNKPASGADAAANYLMWKQFAYLQDLHQVTPKWACMEKASRSLMREEQASMTHLPTYYFFRDGRSHIYRYLSKWMISAFLLPGVTRFPAYTAGEVRFRYSYLEHFALEEPPYAIGYRRDPTSTAAWAEIICSLTLIAGGDLYYECVENHLQQGGYEKHMFGNQISTSRQLNQLDKAIIDICWQLVWALAKQNPLLPFMSKFDSFQKKPIKSLQINKLCSKLFLNNRIGIAQAQEEKNISLSKSLPLLLLRFPGLDEEDTLGGKEPLVHTVSLYPYCGWRSKKSYSDGLRPFTIPHPSLQVMVKDDELLHLNYVWEPLLLDVFHKARPHTFYQEKQINPDEYGRPLEIAELREVQDNKASAALKIWLGGSALKDAPIDLELGELIVNPFPSHDKVQLLPEEPDRVWHLDASLLKAISFDDLHFLHGWMPFFQWIQTEESESTYTKIWVAPHRRLHVLATYVDSYIMNDLSPIHHRVFGLDPTDSNPEKTWEEKMQNLKDNRWKADNRRMDQMWVKLSKNKKLAEYLRPMLEKHMEHLTTPEWIRSREYRRKIRIKERTRKLLSKRFDRADPHTGSIDDPAVLAAQPFVLAAAQRAEIVTSGILLIGHECNGPFWRSYQTVTTGMHRGWDLTYSTSDLRWLLFNENDRSESGIYSILYQIERMATWLIVWAWPHLQNAFFLMQSRTAWTQQEKEKSNWKLTGLSYSVKLERGRTIARLETEEIIPMIWNSRIGNPIIRRFAGSLPFDLFKIPLSDQINERGIQSDFLPHLIESARTLAYKKPGWRSEKRLLGSFSKTELCAEYGIK